MAESKLDMGEELHPHLVYREDGAQARFATWQVSDGHESLALFTTAQTAATYKADLPEPSAWTTFKPPRDTLIEILTACRAGGILYAALDPLGGQARVLFDIPQVLAACKSA